MIWESFMVLLALILLRRYWKHLEFWRRKSVVYSMPIPFFGNFISVIFRRKTFARRIKELYDEFPTHRYNGVFEFSQPKLLIRDLHLVEDVLEKDSDHFIDRKIDIGTDVDDILQRNLFVLKKEKWERIRPFLEHSLSETSVQSLFPTLKNTTGALMDYLQGVVTKTQPSIKIEALEFFRRITNDVIAGTVFGYKCNSFINKDNEFFKMSQELLKIEGATSVKIFLNDSFPWLKKVFRYLNLYPSESKEFFMNLIFSKETPPNESEKCLIPLLMKGIAQEGAEKLDDADVVAQVLSFFFVGFEPLVVTMSFLAYELAIHVQVQKKLQKEVDNILYQSTDEVSYEELSKIRYLDGIILETLRKWPSAVQIDRRCTKDWILPVGREGEAAIRLEEGDVISIPVYGFHHDPKYYPCPEKFDPNRFAVSDIAQDLMSLKFFPFGIGPRNCIAIHYSMLIMKTIFFEIVSRFEIVAIKQTEIPLELSKRSVHLLPENGIYLELRPRK